LQVDACIPNFAIQEYPVGSPGFDGREGLSGEAMMTGLEQPRDGFIRIPDAPGIGVELAPDVVRRFPPKPRRIAMRLHRDGSMVDQ
jgi:galactonate dehydratase